MFGAEDQTKNTFLCCCRNPATPFGPSVTPGGAQQGAPQKDWARTVLAASSTVTSSCFKVSFSRLFRSI